MPKAEYTYTTGDGSPVAPTVYQLGLWIAAAGEEHCRLDEKLDRRMATENTMARLSDLEDHLHHTIAATPAVTLQDAAVQIGTAFVLSSMLDGSNYDHNKALERAIVLSLYRATISALPVIAEAAGLVMKDMGWEQVERIRADHFFGKELGA